MSFYKFLLNHRKLIAFITIIIFFASLVPLLAISVYNHPSVDDFSYGWWTVQAWRETGSVLAVIIEAARYAAHIYKGWQGSFSAVFLMSLQPAVFNEKLYSITPVLMLATLMLSTLYFYYVIIVKMLKADKLVFILTGLVPLALSIQLVPSPIEAYFWFNGSVYYNFFYSMGLFYLSLLLNSLVSKHISVGSVVFMFITAFAVGGSNYTTALFTSITGFCLILFSFLKRDKSRIFMLVSYLVLLISFAVSMLSPGNAVRQAANVKMPPLSAILASFGAAFESVITWTTLPVFLLFLLMLPIAAACVKNTGFSFRLPGLVTVFSFCVFAAQFTPPLYSMSFNGPSRLINNIYFSYYLLVMLNIIYYAGYMKNRFFKTLDKCVKFLLIGAVFITIAFAVSCYKDRHSFASYNAIAQIRSGEANAYHMEQLERLELYNDDSLKNIEIKEFIAKPSLLFFDDITSDPADWRNVALARYYGKESVMYTK